MSFSFLTVTDFSCVHKYLDRVDARQRLTDPPGDVVHELVVPGTRVRDFSPLSSATTWGISIRLVTRCFTLISNSHLTGI